MTVSKHELTVQQVAGFWSLEASRFWKTNEPTSIILKQTIYVRKCILGIYHPTNCPSEEMSQLPIVVPYKLASYQLSPYQLS
uniref:Uncharacterized protein n=1 Tax=Romanomermis culicivorax TaxID=13658 RepID=A0A915LC77_ROMCU